MKNPLRLFEFLSLILIFHVPLTGQWARTNPSFSGNVRCVAASGTTAFYGADVHGVFRTTDGGASWTQSDSGLSVPHVWSLAISGADVFAGTYGGGVFRSTDNGISWGPVNTGLPSAAQVATLAAIEDRLYAGTDRGAYVSSDHGDNWSAINAGLPENVVKYGGISAFGAVGSTLFLSNNGFGVFASTDSGANWTLSDNGIITKNVTSLVVSGTTLFAGTYGGGVFRSTDNGTNWSPMNQGLTSTIVHALAGTHTQLFAATEGFGVFLSTNAGADWSPVNSTSGLTYVYDLAQSDDRLYARVGVSAIWARPLLDFTTSAPATPHVARPIQPSLHHGYPNPFNPSTTIAFTLTSRSLVSVEIYNSMGQRVDVLVADELESGYHTLRWYPLDAPSGTYFCRFVAGDFTQTRPLLLLK